MSEPLLERLRHTDPDVRCRACQEIARTGPSDAGVEALAAALGDPEKAVTRAASDALVAISVAGCDPAPALERALRGETLNGRFGAAFALARLHPPDLRIVPVLLEALADRDGDLRWAACRLLVKTGRTERRSPPRAHPAGAKRGHDPRAPHGGLRHARAGPGVRRSSARPCSPPRTTPRST